jgi:hypothetical protein
VGAGAGVDDMRAMDGMWGEDDTREVDETNRHFSGLRGLRPEVLGIDHGTNGMLIRERRVMVHNDVAILSDASDSDTLDYVSGEEEDVHDLNGVRHVYRDDTWSQNHFTYSPKPMDFLGRRGTTQNFHRIPSPLHLFQLF